VSAYAKREEKKRRRLLEGGRGRNGRREEDNIPGPNTKTGADGTYVNDPRRSTRVQGGGPAFAKWEEEGLVLGACGIRNKGRRGTPAAG